MKLDGFDWFIILIIPIIVIIIGGITTYGEQQQRLIFQQTYNKNLECRQALKDQTVVRVNEICGTVPQIKDFVGRN
jgi:hypothetical protein